MSERPYEEIADDIVFKKWVPYDIGFLVRNYMTVDIESAISEAVKSKDEEIFMLEHAYDYINALNTELNTQVEELEALLAGYRSARDA